MKENVHYWFNPITDVMIVIIDGVIHAGSNGNIAAMVARIQVLNEPESITFDTCLTINNAESRIVNILK